MSDVRPNPIHPGIVFDEKLKLLGWTNYEAGEVIGRAHSEVSRMRNGKMGVSEATALRIAAALDEPYDYWMNLKRQYDLVNLLKAEEKGLEISHLLGRIYRCFPRWKEAEALGWVPKCDSLVGKALNIIELLGISEDEELDLLRFKGRGLPTKHCDLLMVNAWWSYATKQADDLTVQLFSAKLLKSIIRDDVLGEKTDGLGFLNMQRILAKAGVRLVMAPAPENPKINAAVCGSASPTVVVTKTWEDFSDVDHLFFQLLGYLIADQSNNIWLCSELREVNELEPTERLAAEATRWFEDLDITLLLYRQSEDWDDYFPKSYPLSRNLN